MKKLIFLILAVSTVFVSCDEEIVQFDNINGQTLVKFDEPNIKSLPIEINNNGSVDLVLSLSTIATVDRTISISLVSSEIPDSDFDFNSTITVSAGEYTGIFTVSAVDNGLVVGEDYELVFSLDNIEGSGDNVTFQNDTQTISASIFCPIPSDFMVGEYEIEDINAAIGPGNGTQNFPVGVVTLVAGGADNDFAANQRFFSSAVLPAFNNEIETVVINLNCDVFQLGDVAPGLQCTADVPYIFTGTPREDSSVYNLEGSDALFVIEYIEDPDGSCGGPFDSSFILTKVD